MSAYMNFGLLTAHGKVYDKVIFLVPSSQDNYRQDI